MSELDAFSSASAMLAALRSRQVSASELLEWHLRRVARYNPALNAIVTPNYDAARSAAQAADDARARGEDAPLLGLPLTIKDCLDVTDLPTTSGVTARAKAVPKADARLVARVRQAGAVIFGKTNVPPYAGDWQTNSRLFGRTNNPWNPARTPGGSTGGGAAALAAGLTPLEFGSDIGGSIRIPAAYCGVYGHKPSETLVPRSGHVPGTPLPNPSVPMSVQGPLARDTADLELALDVIAGPDVGEDTAWTVSLPAARHERLADFRVAVLPPVAWLPVEREIQAAQERLVASLHQVGARVEVAQPEGLGDLRDFYALYQQLLGAVVSLGMTDRQRRSLSLLFRPARDHYARAYGRGLRASAAEYVIWHAQRERYRAAFRAFFRAWDVLLAPVDAVTAFPHDARTFWRRTMQVDGGTVPYPLHTVYPAIATLCGQPATAFPVGLTAAGLPIGLQAVGPYLEDRTPIRFAALVAHAIGGFQRPPGYDEPATPDGSPESLPPQ